MKKYLYIIVVLAVAVVTVGIGSQVYLAHGLSDVTMTEYTLTGDKKYAEGVIFSQTYYDEAFSGDVSDYYRWDIDTNAENPDNSKVTFTHANNVDDLQDDDSDEDEDPISIGALDTIQVSIQSNDGDDPKGFLKNLVKEHGVYDEAAYDVLKAASDQVENGKSKTVTLTVKDYTDEMPFLLMNDRDFYITTKNGTSRESDSVMRSILKQIPRTPLTGKEKVEIYIKKNKKGEITELDLNDNTSSYDDGFENVNYSILTEKGLFFIFEKAYDDNVADVYYVPMKKDKNDDDHYILTSDSICKKIATNNEAETIETLKWDEKEERLLLVTSKRGKYTLASYNPDDLDDVQKIQLFGKDVLGSNDDGSDDLGTYVYRGDNVWVYLNGTHGLTALQYNDKSGRYDTVLDLNCKQASDQGNIDFGGYEDNTKVTYKDGKLAMLYCWGSYEYFLYDEEDEDDSSDNVDQGETALGIYTEDGLKYYGIYHCSLYDNEVSYYGTENVYQMMMESRKLQWK